MTAPSDSLRGTFPAFLTPLTPNAEIAGDVPSVTSKMLCAAKRSMVSILAGPLVRACCSALGGEYTSSRALMEALPQSKKMLVHVGTGEINSTLELSLMLHGLELTP